MCLDCVARSLEIFEQATPDERLLILLKDKTAKINLNESLRVKEASEKRNLLLLYRDENCDIQSFLGEYKSFYSEARTVRSICIMPKLHNNLPTLGQIIIFF